MINTCADYQPINHTFYETINADSIATYFTTIALPNTEHKHIQFCARRGIRLLCPHIIGITIFERQLHYFGD